jgi:hypothetical protein
MIKLKTYICVDDGDPKEIEAHVSWDVLNGSCPLVLGNQRYEVLEIFEKKDDRLDVVVERQLQVTRLEDNPAPAKQGYKFY